LHCANGNIIVLMDADLAVAPDFVSRHAECHAAGQRRLVCGARRESVSRTSYRPY
jgi:hypothetical protein